MRSFFHIFVGMMFSPKVREPSKLQLILLRPRNIALLSCEHALGDSTKLAASLRLLLQCTCGHLCEQSFSCKVPDKYWPICSCVYFCFKLPLPVMIGHPIHCLVKVPAITFNVHSITYCTPPWLLH